MKRFSDLLMLAGSLLCLLYSPGALAQTNTVLSCGDNASGQIGDRTTTQRLTLTPAFYISGIKAIACGYNHTLALDAKGNVWAWGDNGLGQLGTGDTTPRTIPTFVMGGIKAIAAGAAHSLALDAFGTVWAWGDNANGELGTASGTNPLVPNPMVGMPLAIKAIACGGLHSLMLAQDNSLYGCGYNGFGQLGTGDNIDRSTPTFLTGTVKAMAAGYAHTLILDVLDNVYATGYNADGELGNGTTTDSNTFVWCGFTARSIAAGHFHSLAIVANGEAVAWGSNTYGQLGTGDFTNRYLAVAIPGATNIKAVAGGEEHTLVLTAGGKVLAAGDNGNGQLGDGTTSTHTKLVAVKNASLIGSIAAGSYYSVLLKPFTKCLATGWNYYGQLGIGGIRAITQTNSPLPMALGTSIIAVSAGPSGFYSLLLRADGTVWACGYNENGELGQGTVGNGSTIPVQVLGPGGVGYLTNIIAIAAGDDHNMALAADGSVYTWGFNGDGELGTGDTTDRYYPVQVQYSGSATAIAVGGAHSMMMRAGEGFMYDCGLNGNGQLGRPVNMDGSSFTQVSADQYPIGIAGGGYYSVLLNDDGTLSACGNNYYGQLGIGDTTDRYVPVYESGTQAIAMAAGNFHTLYLNAYGEVFGTGFNGDGELGLGDISNRLNWSYNPYVQAIGIACGGNHSLFVDVYGELFACGNGGYGQLGNGSTGNKNAPTYVPGAPFTIGIAGGYGHTLILTAPMIQVASLKLSPKSVVGGASVTGIVTLTGLAGAGGQTVYLGADSSYVSLPATVTVAPKSKTATFTIKTSSVSSKTVVPIFASLNGSLISASLTINP